MRTFFGILAALAGTVSAPALAQAQAPKQPEVRPSLQNSFRLGTGGDTLCRVQSSGVDPAIKTMFDRAYSIVCRDAAQPIGRIYALRKSGGDPLARLAELRRALVACTDAGASQPLEELRSVAVTQCKLADSDVAYRVYAHDAGRTVYVAEGLAGYDSALTLGLRTVIADRIIPGEVLIAQTQAGDPAAFARVQAGSLDLAEALDEGYRRNNSGNYAEAAEFFDTLLQRAQSNQDDRRLLGEFLINRALQRSNLGAFAEADALFLQADVIPTADPVQLRLRRNFRALHLMNQQKFAEAARVLDKPLASGGASVTAIAETNEPVIGEAAADIINSSMPLAQQLAGTQGSSLTPEERSAILDAQGRILRASLQRRMKQPAQAQAALNGALTDLLAIRDGRVTSIARLRSQGLNELALIAEEQRNYGESERLLREAVAVLSIEYPDSIAVAAANSRLAAYFARGGQTDQAITLYRDIVGRAGDGALSTNISGDMLAPYFALLAREIPRRPELVSDFFLAGETLIRPGVASTQAVLARELSAGDDEAARLFRQAITLTREAEQTRVALARLSSMPAVGDAERQQIATLTRELETVQATQAATQAKLADFPRYRALSTKALTLDDLKASLKPGEAYLKLNQVGGAIYAMLVTAEGATAYRTAISSSTLDKAVSKLRDSISVVEDGQQLTYPFELARARALYRALFDPVAGQLASAQHIIFEPAGAMLKLPLNLLVTDDQSVAAYDARKGTDEFDFRGVAWLGRDRDISTAVSARAFRDVRAVPASRAPLEYLGLGQNAPVPPVLTLTGATRPTDGREDCAWPFEAWNNPISANELMTARGIVGAQQARLLTGEAFTDARLRQTGDLSQYRILHFATHGLVAAPKPECPAQPALLTSFETEGNSLKSDGLLTFKEIFDLRLDADLVILSACDTAGAATAAATREAGLSGGGDFALDGLVRAFIGAGGRSVVASHWPLPDNYDATERLISAMFKAPVGTATTAALRIGQRELMDRAETSHPYYWSGFAVIGDGARPVLRAR
jgi:CHAT domain-containing protein/tetratricopeptide (TPR) repeat protein